MNQADTKVLKNYYYLSLGARGTVDAYLCQRQAISPHFHAIRKNPNNDQTFHRPLIVDGFGKSTRVLFVVLNKECLFRTGLFIILCVVVVCSLSCVS